MGITDLPGFCVVLKIRLAPQTGGQDEIPNFPLSPLMLALSKGLLRKHECEM